MRVLHCIYDDVGNPWVGGGGATRVHEIYRRLGGQVEATVVTGSYPGARDEERDGVRYVRVGAPGPYAWSRLSYARAAGRRLAGWPYDAAVVDFSVYSPVRPPPGRPVGLLVHHLTGASARQRWGRAVGGGLEWLERRALRRARVISAVSPCTLLAISGLVPPRVRLCQAGNGVPEELFSLERAERDYLLYLGRMDWFQKGLDTLLEAVALVARSHPRVRLLLAGRGRDADRVAAAAERLGISPRVRLLGAVAEAEKGELLRGAQLLLMPSRFEGFGLVAAEAMAAGLPVVASDVPGLRGVVQAPAGGRLVPVADPGALADAIRRLLDDPAERLALGRTARAAARCFSWERVARDHLRFLEAVRRQEDWGSLVEEARREWVLSG